MGSVQIKIMFVIDRYSNTKIAIWHRGKLAECAVRNQPEQNELQGEAFENHPKFGATGQLRWEDEDSERNTRCQEFLSVATKTAIAVDWAWNWLRKRAKLLGFFVVK